MSCCCLTQKIEPPSHPKQHFHIVCKGFYKPESQHIKVQFIGELLAVLTELYRHFNTGKVLS